MSVWSGTNFVTETPAEVEPVAIGVGRMTCLECHGDPERYAAAFGKWRHILAPDGCVDCKNRGWVYVST
jgi:hypothetical protein